MFISEQKVYDPKLIISVSQLRSLAAGLQSSVAKYHWNLTVDYVNDRWDTSYKLCCSNPNCKQEYSDAPARTYGDRKKKQSFSEMNLAEMYHSLINWHWMQWYGKDYRFSSKEMNVTW